MGFPLANFKPDATNVVQTMSICHFVHGTQCFYSINSFPALGFFLEANRICLHLSTMYVVIPIELVARGFPTKLVIFIAKRRLCHRYIGLLPEKNGTLWHSISCSCGMVVHTTQVSSGHPKMGLIRLDTIFALTFLSLQVKLFMFLMALLHCYCCSDIW